MTSAIVAENLAITPTETLRARARGSLERCGADISTGGDATIMARSPITGEELFAVPQAGRDDVAAAITRAARAFQDWRTVPGPVRGGVVKRLAQLLTEHKADVAELISIEAGKIPSEALGEVQEMIDICDFAVGLSRQLAAVRWPRRDRDID